MSGTAGYTDVTETAGLAGALPCWAAGAGDFDNDMDADVYLVCTGLIANRSDLIAWNDGHGEFTLRHARHLEKVVAGRGDQVAIADFDRDGFLDLVVTNGNGQLPNGNGPTQLLRNKGNDNNWLEIAMPSARECSLKSNGLVQLREQQGGFKVGAQDDQVLHFGLGGGGPCRRNRGSLAQRP